MYLGTFFNVEIDQSSGEVFGRATASSRCCKRSSTFLDLNATKVVEAPIPKFGALDVFHGIFSVTFRNPKQPPGMFFQTLVNNGIVDHYQPQLVSSPDFLVAISSLGPLPNHQKWSPQRKTRPRGYDIAQVREHDHLELLEVKKRWVESSGKVGSVFF